MTSLSQAHLKLLDEQHLDDFVLQNCLEQQQLTVEIVLAECALFEWLSMFLKDQLLVIQSQYPQGCFAQEQ